MAVNRPLSRSERAAYLANVLSIARSHDPVDRREAIAVRAAAERVGADPSDLLAAKKLLGDGTYGLRYLARPSDRMANMQDMVMVALADGRTTNEETDPIEKLAKVMNFSQADMDMLVQRAEGELQRALRDAEAEEKRASRPLFDSPGTSHAGGGTQPEILQPPPLAPETELPPEPPPPPEAGELLEPGEVRMPAVGVPATRKPPPLKRQPSRPAAKPEPAPAASESRLQRCIRAHDRSAHPRAYCFGAGGGAINPWGCRLANMDWRPGAEWLALGAYRDDRTFVFDKDAIRERLETELAEASVCPHLKIDYIKEAIDVFPDRAGLIGRWRHRAVAAGTPGAQSLTIRKYVQGTPITRRAIARGVDPVETREAVKLIRKATRRSGAPSPEPDALPD